MTEEHAYSKVVRSNTTVCDRLNLLHNYYVIKKVENNIHYMLRYYIDTKLRRMVLLKIPKKLFREDFFLKG